MKKKVYLHIGLHKTGTTSIQVFFSKKKDILETQGILYPLTGRPQKYKFGQHQLPWSIMSRIHYVPNQDWKRKLTGREVDTLWAELNNEIDSSSAEEVVISSEEFDVLSDDEIANVGMRLSNYNVIPVLFIRNHANFIESSYRTAVMHSHYVQSIDHLAHNSRSRLDYFNMIMDWRKIASDEHVVVLNYDIHKIRNNAIVAFFEACIPRNPELLEMAKFESRYNTSYPAYVVEIVKYLRREQVSEQKIEQWITCITNSDKTVKRAPSTCLNFELREAMLSRYCLELAMFLSDNQLSEIGREALDLVEQSKISRHAWTPITNQIDALLFMANGC